MSKLLKQFCKDKNLHLLPVNYRFKGKVVARGYDIVDSKGNILVNTEPQSRWGNSAARNQQYAKVYFLKDSAGHTVSFYRPTLAGIVHTLRKFEIIEGYTGFKRTDFENGLVKSIVDN